MAVRIQRKRTKGWKMPPNAIYVGRPGKWGNPFPLSGYTPSECLRRFRQHLEAMIQANPNVFLPLRGKDLACWCKEGSPCHADILLELANQN